MLVLGQTSLFQIKWAGLCQLHEQLLGAPTRRSVPDVFLRISRRKSWEFARAQALSL